MQKKMPGCKKSTANVTVNCNALNVHFHKQPQQFNDTKNFRKAPDQSSVLTN